MLNYQVKGQTQLFTGWGKTYYLGSKNWVLTGTALAPFALTLIPTVYVTLVFFYVFTYPLCLFYGLLWCALFHYIYKGTGSQDRRRLRWLAFLGAFALPIHIMLTLLGVPSL